MKEFSLHLGTIGKYNSSSKPMKRNLVPETTVLGHLQENLLMPIILSTKFTKYGEQVLTLSNQMAEFALTGLLMMQDHIPFCKVAKSLLNDVRPCILARNQDLVSEITLLALHIEGHQTESVAIFSKQIRIGAVFTLVLWRQFCQYQCKEIKSDMIAEMLASLRVGTVICLELP